MMKKMELGQVNENIFPQLDLDFLTGLLLVWGSL